MTKGANRAWPSLPPGLYSRVRTMLPEIVKFCVVGGIGTVIDLGGAAVLHGKYHVEPLAAKAISVTLATACHLPRLPVLDVQGPGEPAAQARGRAVHRAQRGGPAHRGGGDRPRHLRAWALRGQLDYNAASFIGTGLGTIFRYFAYRKWVFLAPGAPADAEPAARAAGPRLPAVGARPGVPLRPRRQRRPRSAPRASPGSDDPAWAAAAPRLGAARSPRGARQPARTVPPAGPTSRSRGAASVGGRHRKS